MSLRRKTIKTSSEFAKNVISLVKRIPKGKVATYGQIAELAGKPHGSRGVAWILHSCSESHGLPWHRVINFKGKISFPVKSDQYKEQKKRLKQEGVFFDERVDLAEFQWKPPGKKRSKRPNTPKMFS